MSTPSATPRSAWRPTREDLAVNGVAALAAVSGRKIAEVGGWTFRPPFTPVPLTALAGLRSGELMNPLRRLPLEARHRALGAVFDDYGGGCDPPFTAKSAPRTPPSIEN